MKVIVDNACHVDLILVVIRINQDVVLKLGFRSPALNTWLLHACIYAYMHAKVWQNMLASLAKLPVAAEVYIQVPHAACQSVCKAAVFQGWIAPTFACSLD